MAKSRRRNILRDKLGDRYDKAHEKVKGEDTDFGSGSGLPPGIQGGLAQLADIKISEYKTGDNKGQLFFRAAGTVLTPESHIGVRCKGQFTSIMEPLCDTPGRKRQTLEEHLSWVENELRKLGADTDDVDGDELLDEMENLLEEAPYFNFHTWQSKPTEQFPNPSVQETWDGRVEHAEEVSGNGTPFEEDKEEPSLEDLMRERGRKADEGDGVIQTSIADHADKLGIDSDEYETWIEVVEAIIESEGEGSSPGSGGSRSKDDDEAEDSGEEDPEPDEEEEEEEEEEVDWLELGRLADTEESEEGDEALETIRSEARSRGLDDNEYGTWTDLAEELAGGAEAEEPATPTKGEVYLYKPRGRRKALKSEVIGVGEKFCTMKVYSDGSIHKRVKFEDLLPIE